MKQHRRYWWALGLVVVLLCMAFALPRHLIGNIIDLPSGRAPRSQRLSGQGRTSATPGAPRTTDDVYRDYEVKVVRLELLKRRPRMAALSVECRLEDAEPLPSEVTFDTDVVDNRYTRYNPGSSYEEYGREGKRLSSRSKQRPYAMRQVLTIGPLNERTRWLDVGATVYRRTCVDTRPLTFELDPLETIDLGRYPVPGAGIGQQRYRVVRLGGYSLPVYPGAVNLTVMAPQTSLASGSYSVPALPYPCMDVLQFYDEWASQHGWKATSPRPSKWDKFTDGTRPGSPMVYQIIGRWKQKLSGNELSVVCRYELARDWRGRYTDDLTGKWAQDQAVYLSVRPAETSAGRAPQRH
jgi:hypothetical protein